MPITINEIGERLRTQDNRITQDPMFCVQVCQRVYGLEPGFGHDDCFVKITDDGLMEIEEKVLPPPHMTGPEDDEEDEDDEPEGEIKRVGYVDIWRTVMVCFTEQGCKDHLTQNGHNYRSYKDVRIYAESFFRNPEMQAIRNYLMSLPKEVP